MMVNVFFLFVFVRELGSEWEVKWVLYKYFYLILYNKDNKILIF